MAKRNNLWINKKFIELKQQFGNKCLICGSIKRLEFAHKSPTKLFGMSRGKAHRYYDIKNNLDKYILLCHKCHKFVDNHKVIVTSNIGGKEM